MAGFYGTYIHMLDPKNRVFFPAKLRAELGETFFITRKLTKKALAVYTASEWEKIERKLGEQPDSEVGDIKLFLFSHSLAVTPDSQGRILLPPDLTAYAGIEKEVAIVGAGDHIHIYAADEWRAVDAAQMQDLDSVRQRLSSFGL